MAFNRQVRRLVMVVIILTIFANIILLVQLPFKDTTSAPSSYRRTIKFQRQKRLEEFKYTFHSEWSEISTVSIQPSNLTESKAHIDSDGADDSKVEKLQKMTALEQLYLDSHGVEWKTFLNQHVTRADQKMGKRVAKQRVVKREDKPRHILDKKNCKIIKDPQNAVNLNLKTSINDRNDTKGRNETRKTSTPKLITIHPPKGQLGNQMFQLAVLLGLANMTNRTPILTSHFPDLDMVFDLPPNIYSTIDITGFEILTENDTFQFHDLEHMDSNTNWTLDGYFQFFKLFRHIENRVRNTFKFIPMFTSLAKDFIAKSVPPENVTVGVHVRRGDAISSYQRKLGRNAPGIDYYQRAMDFYRFCHKNVTFIVTTDDKRWCQQNFRSWDILFSPFIHKGSDLALLSLCDHTIMSVGTFGWWGAWLAGGTVIYYGQQFRPGSELDRHFVKEDFYPPHWISLD